MIGLISDVSQAAFPLASIPDIGAIGILGLIAVFVYRFLPRLVERAMDEHRRSVSEFAGQLRMEREFFERQMQAERDACQNQFEQVLARHDEQQTRVVAALERLEKEVANR
jgi:hypothetical protein